MTRGETEWTGSGCFWDLDGNVVRIPDPVGDGWLKHQEHFDLEKWGKYQLEEPTHQDGAILFDEYGNYIHNDAKIISWTNWYREQPKPPEPERYTCRSDLETTLVCWPKRSRYGG